MKPVVVETEELTKEEAAKRIIKYKSRFRLFLIMLLICAGLLLLRFYEVYHFGWLAPLILLIFSFFAAVGYYGQYRTLEQKYRF
jgi:hypothetical protein